MSALALIEEYTGAKSPKNLEQARQALLAIKGALVATAAPSAVDSKPAAREPTAVSTAPASIPEKSVRERFMELRGSAREAFLRVPANYAALTGAESEISIRDRHYAALARITDPEVARTYYSKHIAPKSPTLSIP